MAEEKTPTDWAADVKRYVADADDKVIAKIVSYCGIALRTRDASMVSFTDSTETDRVREKFCKKKLALTDSDDVIDAAIRKVGERMSDTRYRNRVTVYYLLAEHFGKLGVFGGASAAAATVVPIVPLAAAAATATANAAPTPTAAPVESAEPSAPAAPAAEAAPAAAAEPAAAAPAAQATAAPQAAAALPPGVRGVYTLRSTAPIRGGAGAGSSGDGFMGLAAAMFAGAATIMIVAAIAGSYVGGRFDAEAPAPAAPAPVAVAPAAEPAAPAIPDGEGIVSEMVEGRPKVSVYFATGKTGIAPDFTTAVAPIKAWLDANPDDRVQLSGFSDPTGNAAANAELAKNRAQAVAAALAEQGVAAERIDLVKPEDSSDATVDLAGARRVEITVTSG